MAEVGEGVCGENRRIQKDLVVNPKVGTARLPSLAALSPDSRGQHWGEMTMTSSGFVSYNSKYGSITVRR